MPGQQSQTATTDLVFGRYQIIRRLAVGGMGEVFLARQSGVAGFDRLVILKSLLPDLAAEKEFVDQFLDEARVAATLNHPNIVSIYEVGQWNGTYFIAMEYIKGDNLSRLQRAADRVKRRVPVDVAAYIAHDAAHALDHAHKASDLQGNPLHIVHRDISPQNIMVRTDGVTKVVDFGIAKAANRSSRTTQTGLLKGKAQYMAPEQVHGQELDARADQFALGVVLWEMIAGRKLFQGKTDIEILKAVAAAPIPPLSTLATISPQLERCVARMLARDRERRYPSLLEAAADLKTILDAGGMKNTQTRTSEFVGEMLGQEIEAKTVDLTPSSANNFVINLSQSAPPPTAPTVSGRGGVSSGKAAIGIAAGVVVAVVLAAVAYVALYQPAAPAVAEGPAPVAPGAKPKIAIATVPAGASVSVDGKDVGKSPVTLEIEPDVEHSITTTLAGFDDHVEKVKLARGQMQPMMLSLAQKKAKLAISASINGAEIRVDGKEVGKAPVDDEVEAGTHEIKASFSKGKESFYASTSVTVAAGETATPMLKLEKAVAHEAKAGGPVVEPRPSEPGKPASFTLDTKPWVKLYIDGKYVDSTPVSRVEVPAGTHKLRLVNEGSGIDETRSITLKSGEVFKQSWPLKSK